MVLHALCKTLFLFSKTFAAISAWRFRRSPCAGTRCSLASALHLVELSRPGDWRAGPLRSATPASRRPPSGRAALKKGKRRCVAGEGQERAFNHPMFRCGKFSILPNCRNCGILKVRFNFTLRPVCRGWLDEWLKTHHKRRLFALCAN